MDDLKRIYPLFALILLLFFVSELSARRQPGFYELISCDAFCHTFPACVKCSTKIGCGREFRVISVFRGKGKTVRACALRQKSTFDACFDFCRNDIHCAFCSPKVVCRKGFEPFAVFGKPGRQWFACKKFGTINMVWPKHPVIGKETAALVVAVGGFGGLFGDDGIEWFCERYFPDDSRQKVLCISSYGSPLTSSLRLAKHISRTLHAIQRVTGRKPLLILVGKSMGGCKLHHAVAGPRKGKRKGGIFSKAVRRREQLIPRVDLFVGIDVSCSVERHFERPKEDLFFPRTVKRLISFYQTNRKSLQTGYRLRFIDSPFNADIHINVNQECVDTHRLTRRPCSQPLCRDVVHATIDDCVPLTDSIKEIIELLVKER